MLVLSRKQGECLVIHGGIVIRILRIGSRTVRLGIDAPPEIEIHRAEILREPAGLRHRRAVERELAIEQSDE